MYHEPYGDERDFEDGGYDYFYAIDEDDAEDDEVEQVNVYEDEPVTYQAPRRRQPGAFWRP